MKKQSLTTLWAFSALIVMSQPPLRDTNTVMAVDNTRLMIDSSYVAHHTPIEKRSPKADSSKKKVRAHEVNKKYKYEVNTSASTKTKTSVSGKSRSSERQ